MTSIDQPLIDKVHFSRFLAGRAGRLHFAAHSHHWWPDVTRDAALAAWDDAARGWDDKWDTVLGPVLATAQGHIARQLNLPRPEAIAFAPNTHEFVVRIFSCFDPRRPIRVLSTDSEFHSFRRQSRRLAEAGLIELRLVSTEPFADFEARFIRELKARPWDLVFLSQVFFDSGYCIKDLAAIVEAAPGDAMVVIDGYHGFMALPTDLGPIAGRAFYLAGGYKYAMSGEGACFLAVPDAATQRPLATGWFASFDTLTAGPSEKVAYGAGGWRFWGATFDPTGLYRFNAVMAWLERLGIGVTQVHEYVLALQDAFLELLPAHSVVNRRTLLGDPAERRRGHFLTFRHADAAALHHRLDSAGVATDIRGDRLRFGFAPYHDRGDVQALLACLSQL